MFSTQYLVRVGLVATEGGVLEATEAREREKEQRCGPLVLSLSHWLSPSLSVSLSLWLSFSWKEPEGGGGSEETREKEE